MAAVAGVTARVVFWVMTDRRFEDALITITHARNAADGIGLTHHPGETRTQGFTSAISVLVPLVGEVLHDGTGLFAIRVVSLIAFALAIVCAAGIGRSLGISQWLMIFPLAYLAFDENQIFYGMAGMETQIATAVLLASLYFLMTERTIATGALLGLALLARPDFILWVVPAIVFLFMRRPRDGIVAGLVGALVTLPWIAFTTLYYGSLIPNTIRAKSLRYPTAFPSPADPLEWVTHTWSRLPQLKAPMHASTPLLESGSGRVPVDHLVLAGVAITFIGLAIGGAWWARRKGAWPVVVTYGALFLLYEIYFLPPPGYYTWYLVPFMALAAIAVAGGLAWTGSFAPRTAVMVSCVLAVAFSVHMPVTFVLEQRRQRIEDRVRMPMALYLGEVVKPGERVVSESAGYVGYYSRVTLYDYPGLTSPGALGALRRLGPGRNTLSALTNAVRPEWLVMRPNEWDALQSGFPTTAALYTLQREFKVSGLESSLSYRGVEYGSIDRDFLVLRRF